MWLTLTGMVAHFHRNIHLTKQDMEKVRGHPMTECFIEELIFMIG